MVPDVWSDSEDLATLPGVLNRHDRPVDPKVSVIVPTLNEARNLPFALKRLPRCVTEVIIVDGRSTDETIDVGGNLRADIRIVHEARKGKGAALQRGFDEATGDIIVMLDADGSADSAEIDAFVVALVSGADFAKGSRFLPGGGSVDLTLIRDAGNRALTAIVNTVCQTRYTDLCYGYNAFWRDCLEFIPVDVDGFEVETRLNMLIAGSGLAVVEVPSHEFRRVYGHSNLNVIRDGWRVLRTIVRTARQMRSGLTSVRSATRTEPTPASATSKTIFIVSGKSPTWLNDHVRHCAQRMTERGRVLVAFTNGFEPTMTLPGDAGGRTLMSIAPSGYPIWTGRVLSSLGLRRRHDTVVVVLSDEMRPVVATIGALVARFRGERIIVHDVTTRDAPRATLTKRVAIAVLDRIAQSTIDLDDSAVESRHSVASVLVGDDVELATLFVDAVSAMADEMASDWHVELHSDDADVQRLVHDAGRTDIVEVVPVDKAGLGRNGEVVIARYGPDDGVIATAQRRGAPTILIDHPIAHRVPRLFGGTWLSTSDVSTLLVALESCRGINEGSGPSVAQARIAVADLVAEVNGEQSRTTS